MGNQSLNYTLVKSSLFDSPTASSTFREGYGILPRGCVSRLFSGTLAQGRAGAWTSTRTRAYRRRRYSKVVPYIQRSRSRVNRARVVRNGWTPRRALTLSFFTFAGKKQHARVLHPRVGARRSRREAPQDPTSHGGTPQLLGESISGCVSREPSARSLAAPLTRERYARSWFMEKCSTPAAFGSTTSSSPPSSQRRKSRCTPNSRR